MGTTKKAKFSQVGWTKEKWEFKKGKLTKVKKIKNKNGSPEGSSDNSRNSAKSYKKVIIWGKNEMHL